MLLLSRAVVTKWDNSHYEFSQLLQSGATFLTMWSRYYKVGQLFQSSVVQHEKAKTLNYFFSNTTETLDFSELNENDRVSDEVNDPTWKPTSKDSKHPSISKIKEKSKSNSLVHYISFFSCYIRQYSSRNLAKISQDDNNS